MYNCSIWQYKFLHSRNKQLRNSSKGICNMLLAVATVTNVLKAGDLTECLEWGWNVAVQPGQKS
jgi:hypothetical protein